MDAVKRYFTGGSTRRTIVFESIVGVVLPVLCLLFDPVVFQLPGGSGLEGGFQPLAVLAYSGIAYEVTLLSVWIALGSRLKCFGPFFGGSFFVGAAGALLLGVVLLPISILGMLSDLIGALGLIPFFTALVYARNTYQCFRKTLHSVNAIGRAAMATCGVGVALALPTVCYSYIPPFTCSQIVHQILR